MSDQPQANPPEPLGRQDHGQGVHSPMESFSSFHSDQWSPNRLAFHQNLEQFADRVGLIVGLQGNGKISQDDAYRQIKQLLGQLKMSRRQLLK